MPIFESGTISGRPPLDGLPGLSPPGDAVPFPMPIAIDGQRIRFAVGTDGDDRIVIEGGATAVGNGGDDVFVLTSNGLGEASERLGVILDFEAGDSLDLSQLGEKAAILGREAERISIDYDGDGDEDGFVLAFDGSTSSDNDGVVTILPFPLPGDVTILPYPLPGEGDGEFHILPFPMPGDGEIVDVGGLAAGPCVLADWILA